MFDNLITVCYAAGSRGEAIARIIELSPSVYRRNSYDMAKPDHLGRMNKSITRFGWWTDFDVQPLFGMLEYMNSTNQFFGFDHALTSDIIADWQRIVPKLWFDQQGDRKYQLCDIIKDSKIVTSDHVHSLHLRQLLPGAKTIAVCGDSAVALDLLYQKWWMSKPMHWSTHQPNIHAVNNLDREVANGRDMLLYPVTDSERKDYVLSQFDEIRISMELLKQDHGAFAVDFVQLFDRNHSKRIYHDMMEYLDCEPNWPEVSGFIDRYNACQPSPSMSLIDLLK
jgi:hypothetical protein